MYVVTGVVAAAAAVDTQGVSGTRVAAYRGAHLIVEVVMPARDRQERRSEKVRSEVELNPLLLHLLEVVCDRLSAGFVVLLDGLEVLVA